MILSPVAVATASTPVARPARPAGPAEGSVVARLVVDGMPGEGVRNITKGARIEPTRAWSSLADAEAAMRLLTQGDDVTAAGIFRRDGRFEAYELRTGWTGMPRTDPYYARENDNVARTVDGRGLVTIVDGDDIPTIISAREFRRYERYAGE